MDEIQIEKKYVLPQKRSVSEQMTKTEGSSHVSIIPFPVCEYAAIHYKDGGRLKKLYTRKKMKIRIKFEKKKTQKKSKKK